MMAYAQTWLFVVLGLVVISLQQDPVVDFCRRWDHQAAVVDSKLYIDGGMVKYNAQTLNYTNNFLLYSDLNTPRHGTGFPTQRANLSKPAHIPSVSGGYIWSDEHNKCFYQFGGEYANGASPTDFSMWTYDVILHQWNTTTYKSNDKALQRVSYGSGTQAEHLGAGFYFGGYVNSRTTPGWSGSQVATSGIVRFDYNSGAIKNTTHPDLVGRAEGQMVFVPVSDSGILIYFGGIEDPGRNGSRLAANMSIINIYDIASSRWYKQTASGDVPDARRRFCAGMSAADDLSSYNIYLYGGYGFDTVPAFNDVYILSLPSFRWVKAYPLPSPDPIPYPDPAGHGGCTASLVRPDQMIVLGGSYPDPTHVGCDSPETQGQHNMILGNNTAKQALWDQYDPKLSKYAVPSVVIVAIGGGSTGGATVTAPASWDHPDLRAFYSIRPTFAVRTATRPIPSASRSRSGRGSKKSNAGVIVAGVIGGLLAVIAMLASVWWCLRRRRTVPRAEGPAVARTSAPPAELAVTPVSYEMSNKSPQKLNQDLYHGGSDYMSPCLAHVSPSHVSGSPLVSSYHTLNHCGTYQSTNQVSSSNSSHNEYIQQSPIHQGDAVVFFPSPPSDRNSPPSTWDQHHHPSQPPNGMHHPYAYPTPKSPLQQNTFTGFSPTQVYFPPPPEPRAPAQYSPSSFTNQSRSPIGTYHSSEHTHSPQPPYSTTNTPVQFYAPSASTRRMDDFTSKERRAAGFM